MACFAFCNNDWDIKIENHDNIDNVTYYEITVRFGPVFWKVKRRFSEFLELCDRLSVDHGLSKDNFPPKRFNLFKSKPCPELINERMTGLTKFLKSSFDMLKVTMPRSLVLFLQIDCYDIYYNLESLSLHMQLEMNEMKTEKRAFYEESTNSYTFSLLQAHALTKVLKLPRPSLDIYGLRLDYSDMLEICGNLEQVTICGEGEYLMNSNIIPANLQFDISPWKSVRRLELNGLSIAALTDASDLRRKLVSIVISNCCLKSLSELLLCDVIYKDLDGYPEDKMWLALSYVNLSCNEDLSEIDKSVSLMPNVKRLDLRQNSITNLHNLHLLEDLHHLNVSCNQISSLESSAASLSNLISLDISSNKMTTLKGFERLTKLNSLNLAFNLIESIEEVKYVVKLPMLDNIVLTGNPLSSLVDYRIKVLVEFGLAHRRIVLDNEESTQKELDTVAVKQALSGLDSLPDPLKAVGVDCYRYL